MEKEMPELKVAEVETDSLVAYANNSKIHTREQVEQIMASIREFGFNDPVAVWTNDKGEMEIVEGHGRVMAAKEIGMGTVPVIRLDHMSDEQRRAYTHIHNRLTMNTGLDYEVLAHELKDITGFEWEGLGFDYVVLADTTSSVFEPEEFDYEPDAASDATVYTVVCRSEEQKEAVMALLGVEYLKRMYRVGEL